MEAYINPDFETIKFQLKSYLKNNSDFKDFNWEGSNLSVLIDLLSYNANNQQLYNAAALAESSLDSAQKRANIIAHAKTLGYTPKSKKAASAIVNISVTMPPSFQYASFSLMKGDSFETQIDNQSFTFIVAEEHLVTSNNKLFEFPNITLVQGKFQTYTYPANSQPTQRYVIPSKDVDIDFIKVMIQPSNNVMETTEFTLAEDIVKITGDSNVYFIQENFMGYYEIFFGDGILGKRIEPQNIIHIEYLVTKGAVANHARSFYRSKIYNLMDGSIGVRTVQAAVGGSERESNESIKFHAPRNYTTQGRAVTASDYVESVFRLIPGVESVNVWGGDEDPKHRYGIIFISIKTESDMTYNPAYKKFIIDKLKSNVSTVKSEYEIVDPNFIYISVTTIVRREAKSITSDSELRLAVESAISDYSNNNLSKFGRNFYLSSLMKEIDNSHPDIVSNKTQFNIQKRIYWENAELNFAKLLDFTFGMKLKPKTLVTSVFYVPPMNYKTFNNVLTIDEDEFVLKDDGNGNVHIQSVFRPDLQELIGSINYNTGSIYIESLIVGSIPMYPSISFNVSSLDDDLLVSMNTILLNEKRLGNAGSSIDPGIQVEIV